MRLTYGVAKGVPFTVLKYCTLCGITMSHLYPSIQKFIHYIKGKVIRIQQPSLRIVRLEIFLGYLNIIAIIVFSK